MHECEVKIVIMRNIQLQQVIVMEPSDQSRAGIMKDLHNHDDSVEIAKQDLNIIFNKINDSLRDLDQKKSVKPIEKENKSEVSFQIEDHQQDKSSKAARGRNEVPHGPELTSLPYSLFVPSQGTTVSCQWYNVNHLVFFTSIE